jgi:hypothetical protein
MPHFKKPEGSLPCSQEPANIKETGLKKILFKRAMEIYNTGYNSVRCGGCV